MADNNIVSRLKLFMDQYSLNSLALANALGYRSSEKISRLFRNEGAKPSYDIIYDISSKFDINTDWLVTGRGEMLVKERDLEHEGEDESVKAHTVSNQPPIEGENTIIYNMYKEEREKVEAQAEQIGALKQTIKQLEEKIEGLQEDMTPEDDSGNVDVRDAGIAYVG